MAELEPIAAPERSLPSLVWDFWRLSISHQFRQVWHHRCIICGLLKMVSLLNNWTWSTEGLTNFAVFNIMFIEFPWLIQQIFHYLFVRLCFSKGFEHSTIYLFKLSLLFWYNWSYSTEYFHNLKHWFIWISQRTLIKKCVTHLAICARTVCFKSWLYWE